MSPSSTTPVGGRLVNVAMWLIVFCFLCASMTPTVVGGFLVPHRKNEVPDDLSSQQLDDQLSGRVSSGRAPDVKKSKKGVSVNVVNVHVDNDQVWTSDSNIVPVKPVSNSAQCNATAEKVDCAFFGVTRDQCHARGCCYIEIRDGPEPWCYLPKTSLVSQCQGREESRLQCGYYNIERDECNSLGCCWRPTSTSGTPWCYQADSDTSMPGSGDDSGAEPASFECGVPHVEPNVNLRIVGGVEAVPHSWPWMVSLQRNGYHYCGGSLINDRWVVSAAHCGGVFDDINSSSVVIGLHNHDSPDQETTERVGVEKVIINQKYLAPDNGISNDVILIKLARPVTFNTAVLPVCLPQSHQTIEIGTRCWATGWGDMEAGAYVGSRVLNQVVLPIIDNEVCNQPEWYDNEIDDTMVCAGYQEGGRDSCQGDSGGPLVCNEDGKWTLHGIVSWGHGCAGVNKPGLYTRTSAYSKWINQQISANSD